MQTESSNSSKVFSILTVLAVLGFAGYYFFFRTTVPKVTLDEFGNEVETSVIGQDLVSFSTKLESITLDTSSLKKKTFTKLVDFGITIPKEAIGRRNPFADFSSVSEQPVEEVLFTDDQFTGS